MGAKIFKLYPRPNDEIFYCTGQDDIICVAKVRDARGNMHGNAANILVCKFNLSSVDADTYSQAQLLDRFAI